MKKYIPLIGVSLALCLFIYVFYRTDKTIINQLVIAVWSRDHYHQWKELVHQVLPLKPVIVYSLPEGLWVFCITMTSRFFRLNVLWFRIDVAALPLILATGMELCQLVHLTRGRFDLYDLLFATLFWWVAYTFTDTGMERRNLRFRTDLNSFSCIFSYSIVYLAHVIN